MGGVKKSAYVFLCSLLGVLLFLVLQRIVAIGYLVLVVYGVVRWTSNYSYIEFLAVDYITMLLAMMFGSWYGIWLGTHWYEQIYERGAWSGVFSHMRLALFPRNRGHRQLKEKVESLKQRLFADLGDIERLVPEISESVLKPAAVKRVSRKKRVAAGKKDYLGF